MKKAKLLVINSLATLCEISFFVQQFFLDGNKLSIVEALWFVLTLGASLFYVMFSFAVFFTQNEGHYVKLTKRHLLLIVSSYMLISLTIVLAIIGLLLHKRLIIIIILSFIISCEIILRLILVLGAKLEVKRVEDIDYSQYSNKEVVCSREDEIDVAFSIGVSVLMAFILLLPCISIGFENLKSLVIGYHIILLISILFGVLCIKKLLKVSKKFNEIQKKIKNLTVCLVINQIIISIFIWILYFGYPDYFRAFIATIAIISFIQVILSATVPLSKLDIQMKLYIQNHFN